MFLENKITIKSARKPTHFSRWMNCQIFLNSYKYTKIIQKSFIYFFILRNFCIFIFVGHNKDEILKIRITKEQREAYSKWCKEHKLHMSKRIRDFIDREMNQCKS